MRQPAALAEAQWRTEMADGSARGGGLDMSDSLNQEQFVDREENAVPRALPSAEDLEILIWQFLNRWLWRGENRAAVEQELRSLILEARR